MRPMIQDDHLASDEQIPIPINEGNDLQNETGEPNNGNPKENSDIGTYQCDHSKCTCTFF